MVTMNGRVVVFLFVVISCWSCIARDLTANHITDRSAISTALQDDKLTMGEAHHVGEVIKNENLCMLCEKFASDALNYLSDNKTQAEIMNILHKSCSQLSVYRQQCTVLVDYYGPLFFLEASKMNAKDFCRKFDLCKKGVSIYQHVSKDKCDVCHDFVTLALIKLKDPDTELEIVQLLLKACNSIGKTAKKCKRLVFEYAPIILVNAEQFLETNDVCGMLHVCDSTAIGVKQELLMHAVS